MSITEIGCCGAYCKTCRAYRAAACRGCKTGYEGGQRDLQKAKCRMKICCLQKNLQSCADCAAYESCQTLNAFYEKNGAKYRKYRQATRYIRQHGYAAFLRIANQWTGAHGRYPEA